MTKSAWDSTLYLRFAAERTQPALDLAARLPELPTASTRPLRIIDLGCGPGNSTAVLAQRYPAADLSGLDSSADMLAQARDDQPGLRWEQGDIATWAASQPYDMIFSNAVLHWLGSHETLVPHLLLQLLPGGVLAFQMPRNYASPDHTASREIALDPRWNGRLEGLTRQVHDVPDASFYYDLLAPLAASVTVWETVYHHVLADHAAMVDWMKGTGLRPYLDVLDPEETPVFLDLYQQRLEQAFAKRADGRVLFPFRRIFVIAKR